MEKHPEEVLLTHIVSAIVEFPDKLQINRTTDERGILLTIQPAIVDIGRIIGRAGATIETIRNLMYVFSVKNRLKISIKVEEPRSKTNI